MQKKQTKKEKIRRIGTMLNGGDTNTHDADAQVHLDVDQSSTPAAAPGARKNDDVVGKFTRNIWSHGKNHPIPKHPFCELYVKKRQKSILHCELVENWGKTPLPNNIGMVTLCETHYINRSSKAQLRLQRHSPYQIVLYSFEEEQIIEIQHGNLKIPWKFPESCTHNLKWDPVGFL